MALLYSKTQKVGWGAPNFHLKDTEEKFYSGKDFLDKKGLLVVFTCNHCPYAQAAWPLLVDLYDRFGKEVAFVGINPNDELTYPDDSFSAMKEKKKAWGIPFPYLRDETQAVAKAYNAQCTPDPYLCKNEGGVFKLFYHGRVNDNWQDNFKVREKNLEDALNRLITNQSSPENQPPSMGCSIKWKVGS